MPPILYAVYWEYIWKLSSCCWRADRTIYALQFLNENKLRANLVIGRKSESKSLFAELMAGDLSKSTKALRPVQSNRSERRDNYFSATLTTVSLYSPLDNQLSERDGNARSQTVVCAPRIFLYHCLSGRRGEGGNE